MPKQNDKSLAEDYLAQLNSFQQPRYRGGRGWPWWTNEETGWKYNPVTGEKKRTSPLVHIFVIGGFITLIVTLLYLAISLAAGEIFYMAGVLILASMIVFFAIRDGAKPKNNDASNDEE